MSRRLIAAFLLLVLSITAGASRRRPRQSNSAFFDYYLLALSWAPEFCSTHAANAGSLECGAGRHLGFVVHGLWPQKQNGPWPQHCGPARPVAHDVVQRAVAFMPDPGLVQHEWATHGTCSGLSPQDYFATVERAYQAVQVPQRFQNLAAPLTAAPGDIAAEFTRANHAPEGSFVVTCARGEIVAVEACLTKDLKYRQCASDVRACSAPQVRVLPPK